jgi:Kef-type K+ transport system membrane component KefB
VRYSFSSAVCFSRRCKSRMNLCLAARRAWFGAAVITVSLCAAQTSWAASIVENKGVSSGVEATAHGLDPLVLLSVALILIVAKVGGEIFERLHQPAVLGELIGGIVVGNLTLVGCAWLDPLKTNEVIAALAEIGVILLLFEVGLESNLTEMLKIGWSALFVALAGITASFFLGWGVAAFFAPAASRLAHLYLGAALCATSVGITARVLRDMNKLGSREARVILGAAIIDDVLCLIILALAVGAIKSVAEGATLGAREFGIIAVKAFGFLFAAIVCGRYVVPHLFRGAGKFESRGVLLALAISFCFVLAWAAAKAGLAPIIGAFAAGLVLDEIHFEPFPNQDKRDLQQLIAPVSALVVPVFFVMVGVKVDLRVFMSLKSIGLMLALTLAAIIGKQACMIGTIERGINRLSIGFGMIPRGEVELIFAGIGATLLLPNAQGVSEAVIDAGTFGAIVGMVIITTLVTPFALKWSFKRRAGTETFEQ